MTTRKVRHPDPTDKRAIVEDILPCNLADCGLLGIIGYAAR
jgi:hypothetical protein